MTIPRRVVTLLLDGVTEIPVDDLSRMAQRQGSLVTYIRQRFRIPLSAARHFLHRKDREVLQQMRQADFDTVLDAILAEAPDHGVVLFQHQAWYFREMQALQAALIGEA